MWLWSRSTKQSRLFFARTDRFYFHPTCRPILLCTVHGDRGWYVKWRREKKEIKKWREIRCHSNPVRLLRRLLSIRVDEGGGEDDDIDAKFTEKKKSERKQTNAEGRSCVVSDFFFNGPRYRSVYHFFPSFAFVSKTKIPTILSCIQRCAPGSHFVSTLFFDASERKRFYFDISLTGISAIIAFANRAITVYLFERISSIFYLCFLSFRSPFLQPFHLAVGIDFYLLFFCCLCFTAYKKCRKYPLPR